MGPQLLYQLRLALRDLRHNPTLSLTAVLCLALATGLWSAALEIHLRVYGPVPALSPALHQVELPHRTSLARSLPNSLAAFAMNDGATRLTFSEAQALAASGVPSRQTLTTRARLLFADPLAPVGTPPSIVNARFVNPDFFALFDVVTGAGRPFDATEEAGGAPVMVIGRRLAEATCADACVGRTMLLEGQPFRIVGVATHHQPYRPVWDSGASGAPQDALYLPWPWFERLRAYPEVPVYQSAQIDRNFDDFLRSDTLFVAFWAELPTAAQRAAFQRHLTQRFGARGITTVLRSYPEWVAAFPMPSSGPRFLFFVTGFVLLGAGFNISRLLLAKALARRSELGIHRALGAPRAALFLRQLFEATLLAAAAALLGVGLARPFHLAFNHLVADNDVPLALSALGVALAVGSALLTGISAAIYPALHVALTAPTVYLERR